MNNLKHVIRTRLKEAREESNLTQAELADLVGMKRNSYNNYETGANWITVRRLVKIKEVLGKSADWFLGGGAGELSDDELRLVELYRSITDKKLKDLIIGIVRLFAQASENKKE